jgi:hypothetical protein
MTATVAADTHVGAAVGAVARLTETSWNAGAAS